MKHFHWFSLYFPLIFSTTAYTQSHNSIVVDKLFSPYIGSENIISLYSFMDKIEGKVLKTRFNSESTVPTKALGLGYRSLKTIFLDYPATHILWIFQHEVFGHGYRAREGDVSKISYAFALPFPYGKGNGSTRLDQDFLKLTLHEKSALFFSGSQASAMIANSLRLRFIKNGSIHYKEALLYFIAFSDLTNYILSTDYKSAKSGNDVINYIQVTYPGKSIESELKKLKNRVIVNYLSPFPYFALYTFLKTYYWNGNSKKPLPMIPISGIQYLPSFRFGLSPFGYEIYFENFIHTTNNTINFYLRYGEPGIKENWGSGVTISNLFRTSHLSLDGSLHFWKQPSINLGDSQDHYGDTCNGYSALLTMFLSPVKDNNINFLAQMGYKSRGFLENENLSNHVLLRVGLSFLDFQ